MSQDRLREMVAEQVRRALRGEALTSGADSPPDGPTVLAVFCGGHVGLETALAQVRILAQQARIVALLTEAAKGIIGPERLRTDAAAHEVLLSDGSVNSRDLAHRAQVVAVAQLTRTTLAKVATGAGDTPATNLVLHALLGGTPVVVARDGVDPKLAGCAECTGGADTAPGLLGLYDEYLDRLAAFGCHVVPARQLADAVAQALVRSAPRRTRESRGRRVVSEEDVIRASRRGESLDVTGCIVTALARDAAQQLGVALIDHGP